MFGSGIDFAPRGMAILSTRISPADRVIGIWGPPKGQPLPNVISSRRPSRCASPAAKCKASMYGSERYCRFRNPVSGLSSARGYNVAISTPPIPAAFICSSSRWISGLVTAGPNHHQRIMMREPSGGCVKDSRKRPRSVCVWARAPVLQNSRIAKTTKFEIVDKFPSPLFQARRHAIGFAGERHHKRALKANRLKEKLAGGAADVRRLSM